MTLLVLAGTGEAVQVAAACQARGISAVASLAGATRSPRDLRIPTRHGGFGGEDGFVRYIEAQNITAVLDATHPYASRISHRTTRICTERSMPYCQLLRPPWRPGKEDNWTALTSEEDAAQQIPLGSTVFLATGRQTLNRYANLSECRLICRQIDPPETPFPFPNGEYLVGRPPFSVEDEVALFRNLGVDWLVVKNAGGAASYTKLDAARILGIPVAMIDRPPQPEGQKVTSVEAALDWIAAL